MDVCVKQKKAIFFLGQIGRGREIQMRALFKQFETLPSFGAMKRMLGIPFGFFYYYS